MQRGELLLHGGGFSAWQTGRPGFKPELEPEIFVAKNIPMLRGDLGPDFIAACIPLGISYFKDFPFFRNWKFSQDNFQNFCDDNFFPLNYFQNA